jgi:diphthine-ammonia ligase
MITDIHDMWTLWFAAMLPSSYTLISGGKDSCFNMMECVRHGHQIAVLVNIYPAVEDTEEMDSFMYQTVGHEAIQAYSDAMGLPLYRAPTKGQAVTQTMEYTENQEDEVEDLYRILDKVKRECQIDAVSVGAIASDYQRLRVEHVCQRLGLEMLAYLWHREQKKLMAEMISSGLNAIIIKVAAMGLSTKHLGRTLSDVYPQLCDLNSKYGLHVCGEGGEFETFTLDCPLFKKAIVVGNTEVKTHSDDAFAPVAYLKLKDLSLQTKS